jgi:hypothetical protein
MRKQSPHQRSLLNAKQKLITSSKRGDWLLMEDGLILFMNKDTVSIAPLPVSRNLKLKLTKTPQMERKGLVFLRVIY